MPETLSAIRTELFRRDDESPDSAFYATPRLVTHIDAGAIAEVTKLYRKYFPPGGWILDLMSSWISHLPEDVSYGQVVGLGMNADELIANRRLDDWIVQDLNENPRLPFPDASFDACGICVSIQYLTDPVTALRDVGRVLAPGAPVVITFSNRCFPTKAVAIWQFLSDEDRCRLVALYLRETGMFSDIIALDRSPSRPGDPLFAVIGKKTETGEDE